MHLSHVKKRDGRLVPFNIERLKQSIVAAAESCDITDDFYARELAEAVALHLSKKFSNAPLETKNIAEAVEHVLKSTNYNGVADAYASFRFSREQNRSLCTVLKPVQSSLIDADILFQVTSSHGQRSNSWDRSKIVHALEKEANIGKDGAENIARAVEEKLLSSDLRHVTTTLIRALTDNELLTRGYTGALRQSSSVTIPFSDLEFILESNKADNLNEALGKQISAPYTLSHMFSENVAMAHRRGIINISGLEHPFSIHEKSVVLSKKDFQLEKLRELWILNLKFLIGSKLSKINFVFEKPGSINDLAYFLNEVCDYSSFFANNVKIALLFPACLSGNLKTLLSDCEPVPEVMIGFYNFPRDINKFAEIFSEISNKGWKVSWSDTAITKVVSQKISLNMPQSVYRARQHDLDGVIEEIYRSLDLSVQAHKQFCVFDRTSKEALPENHSAAVEIIGLKEAVSILTGSGLFENNESAACTRVLLSSIQYGLQQASEPFGLSMLTSIDDSNTCGKRLATIDQSLFPELFGFLPLQPENIESFIPPYDTILLEKSESQTHEAFAKEVSNIHKHFSLGFAPISFYSETDKNTVTSLIKSKSSFVVLPNITEEAEAPELNENQMNFDL